MPRLLSRRPAAALALVLALVGCDASTDTSLDTRSATADTEDAVQAVARSLSLDGGGALEDAAAAVSVADRPA